MSLFSRTIILFTVLSLSFNLELSAQPSIDLGSDTTICGGNLLLEVNAPNSTFLWNTGDTSSSITVSQTNTYSVTATDASGVSIDSIFVEFWTPLALGSIDTSLCQGYHDFSFPKKVLWYEDSLSSIPFLLDSLNSTFINKDTAIWVQDFYPSDLTQGGVVSPPSNGPFFSGTGGLQFDVHNDLILYSVDVYCNNTGTLTINLHDANDNIINSQTASVTPGLNTVELDFFIPAGNAYRLRNGSQSTVGLQIANSGISYPYLVSNDMSITNQISGNGNINFNIFIYFFNWQVATPICTTSKSPIRVNLQPGPALAIPAISVTCDTLATIAPFSDTSTISYLWNTGDTSSTIQVASSGTYTLVAASNYCVDSISTEVLLITPYGNVSNEDTTACAGNLTLSLPTQNLQSINWYTDSTSNNLIGRTPDLKLTSFTDTTLWFERVVFDTLLQTGLTSPVDSTNPQSYYLGAGGLVFDAHKDFLLTYIDVWVLNDGLVVIELQDENNMLLMADSFLVKEGRNTLNLNFFIPSANNLRLRQGAGTTAPLHASTISPFPITLNDYTTIKSQITGSNVLRTNTYAYFYNWNIANGSCISQRGKFDVTVQVTPFVDMSADTLVCDTALSISIGSHQPTMDILWSNGDTTATTTIINTGFYYVTANIGTCSTSDSLWVSVITPTVNAPFIDTTVCSGEVILQLPLLSEGAYEWYPDSLSQNAITRSRNLSSIINTDTVFWVQTSNHDTIISEGKLTPEYVGSSLPFFTGTGGLVFDAKQDFILSSITVYALQAGTVQVDLVDNNTTIQTATFPVQSGANELPLNFTITQGNGYSLRNGSSTNVSLHTSNTNITYPYERSPFCKIRWQISGSGTIRTDIYTYFYNWEITKGKCTGPRVPFNVTVVDFPEPLLPQDSVLCNNTNPVTLNAQNPGTSYLWSTGDTTQSITVNTTDFYTVTMTNGGLCSTVDGTQVQYATPPSTVLLNDTSVCSSGTLLLGQPANDGIIAWGTNPALDSLIGLDAPLAYEALDTNRLFLRNAAKGNFRIGPVQATNPANLPYLSFAIADTFAVEDFIVLDSVAVYANQAGTSFDITLRNAQGQLLHSQSATVNQPFTKTFIPLQFPLAPGRGYELAFDNLSGGSLGSVPTNYPYQGRFLNVQGNTVGTPNSYFVDWNGSYAVLDCAAPTDSLLVTVRHPLNLPDSVFTCDSVTLDAFSPGTQYTWSTGVTTPELTVQNPGMYTVTISDGANCTATDSTLVATPMPVGLPADGLLCGDVLTTAYGNDAGFFWSDSSTAPSLTITGPGTYSVEILSPEGCTLEDSVQISGIEAFPTPNLGADSTVCTDFLLNAGAYDSYTWNTGATTDTLSVTSTGFYAVTVSTPNGCAGQDSIFLIVDPLPVADFSFVINENTVAFTNNANNATQFQWDFGDGSGLVSAANPFHLFPGTGNYEVNLYVSNDCGTDTSTQQIVLVNTQELAQEQVQLQLFPNPNSGQFQVQANLNLRDARISVWNSLGQEVYRKENIQQSAAQPFEVNLSALAAGTYVLILEEKAHIFRKVFLIRR